MYGRLQTTAKVVVGEVAAVVVTAAVDTALVVDASSLSHMRLALMSKQHSPPTLM